MFTRPGRINVLTPISMEISSSSFSLGKRMTKIGGARYVFEGLPLGHVHRFPSMSTGKLKPEFPKRLRIPILCRFQKRCRWGLPLNPVLRGGKLELDIFVPVEIFI